MNQVERGLIVNSLIHELMEEVGKKGTQITFEQAAELIKLAELHKLRATCRDVSFDLENLYDLLTADVSLKAVCSNLADINTTLFNTLGSYKTGAALDAVTEIAHVMQNQEEEA